jgi:hypothetical protein
MIEVFKTNVQDPVQANMLIHHIHELFGHYRVNFDLEDCDKILRIQSKAGIVEPEFVIELLRDFGFSAEVLPDDAPVETRMARVMRHCSSLYFYQPYHPQ